MSYCRFGSPGSEIYAYRGDVYNIVFPGGFSLRARSLRRFRDQLVALKAAGIKVPKRAIDRANAELDKEQSRE